MFEKILEIRKQFSSQIKGDRGSAGSVKRLNKDSSDQKTRLFPELVGAIIHTSRSLYRHRNDPHHRNDTGGHCRNDPLNMGMELRGLHKLDNNLVRSFYLFILRRFCGV